MSTIEQTMSKIERMETDFENAVSQSMKDGFDKSTAEKVTIVGMLSDVQELVQYHDTQESKEKIRDLTNAIKVIVMERGLA